MVSTPRTQGARYSIIVPTCNNAAVIAETLRSIRADMRADCELIVADDKSTDNTRDIAAPLADILLALPERRGPARARNLAAKNASGEFLLFTDSDVLWPAGLLDKFDAAIAAHPDRAGVATFASGEPLNSGLLPLFHALTEEFLVRDYLAGRADDDYEYITTRCGTVRRDLFLASGGFDERFLAPSIEDFEFSVRFNRANRFVFVPDSGVRHYWAASLSKILSRLFRNACLWAKTMYGPRGFGNAVTTRERAAANLAGAASLFSLPLALIDVRLLALPAALTVATALLNRRFISFARRRKGFIFSLIAAAMQQISSVAVLAGAVRGILTRNKSDKWHELEIKGDS